MVGVYLFAVVARIESLSVGEVVLQYGTMVRAAGADLLLVLELLNGKQLVKGHHLGDRLFASIEGAAVGTHQFGDVGETNVLAGEQFQCAHHSQILESAALHYDVVAEFLNFSQF